MAALEALLALVLSVGVVHARGTSMFYGWQFGGHVGEESRSGGYNGPILKALLAFLVLMPA